MLSDEDRLEVDILGSRNDVGGVGIEILRGALAAAELSLLARLGGWPAGDGEPALAFDEASAFLGEPFVLRRSGTMVVTPLTLLASDADE